MASQLASMFAAGALLAAAPTQAILMFEQDSADSHLSVESESRSAVSDALFARQYRSQLKAQPAADDLYQETVEVCDAMQGCDSKTHTCVAEVKNGKPDVDFKLKVFENDKYISRMALCQQTTWEYGTVNDLLKGLKDRKGWGFLDIGANIGSWTLPTAMEMKGHGGKLVAVEADPQTIGALTESVNMNGLQDQVSLIQKAVVQDDKKLTDICLTMGDATESGNVGENQANLGERDGKAACKKWVKTMSLDALYETNPDMKNMIAAKLDCEGCEGQAIMGGTKFLSEAPPCFLAFEATERYLCESKTPLKQVKEFLEKHGYDTKDVTVHGGDTCEEYAEWEKANGGVTQNFYTVQRHDMDACMNRFEKKL